MIYPAPKPRAKRKPSGPHPLKKSRLKSRGKRTKKSGGALFPKSVRPEYRDYIRAQRCVLSGRRRVRLSLVLTSHVLEHECVGAIQACHVTSRGAGGADLGNLYAGCAAAHHEQHAIGIPAFEKRWGIRLADEAARLWEVYQNEGHTR